MCMSYVREIVAHSFAVLRLFVISPVIFYFSPVRRCGVSVMYACALCVKQSVT
jgi:hypothetical protein